MTDNSTSEVGSVPDAYNIQAMWKEFFEQQNGNFSELIKLVKGPSEVKDHVVFPRFNPDVVDTDASAWCATVDLIMTHKVLKDSELILSLSKALTGEASRWFTQICFSGITWDQFKELFKQRFVISETPAAFMMNLFESSPKNGECISVYASRITTALESKLKDMSMEEIAVCLTLASVAHQDYRLKRLVYTTDIKTRSNMQHELKAFSFGTRKGSFVTEDSESNAKKRKFAVNTRCHYCGKSGHRFADCRARKSENKNNQMTKGTSFLKKEKSIICYRCGVPGHFSSVCQKNAEPTPSKRVDVCRLVEPTGTLEQFGESFPFYFDSGSECSIIKETIAAKMAGQRVNKIVSFKGIGNATVVSTLQIRGQVVISDFSLEILFHVVVDDSIKYDIIVGREILNLGYGFIVTSTDFELFKSNNINLIVKDNVPTKNSNNEQSSKNELNFVNLNTELVGTDRMKLLSILERYSDHFISGIPEKRVTSGQLKLRLIDPCKTVQRRPYRLSSEERHTVREMINDLISAGIVRPSCSPFASPILLVKKKNGTDRLCVDYRELNANTIADKFPLPLISDQISRLKGAKYFSCLDMASGFYQIPIHEESIEKTAFVTPDGQFEFLVMPFGLKNAPSVFQRAILKALGDLAYSFVIVYMDDVMVVASTIEEALSRLTIVFEALCVAGFSFNLTKCEFLKTSVEYLGYLIEDGRIRPNPQKIFALNALPPPQSVTQLRQFIGLASYFRQFVHQFSIMMKPLYRLTADKIFVWKPFHEKIRLKIIAILTQHPVLVIFDPSYPIELHTDASAIGYGAILLQRIENKPHVIEYYSKTTSEAESKYHSYELETLAVVNAIKHFRHYLHGHKFVVFTDCNSLKSTRNKKDLTPRVYRWWSYLQNFEFDIEYREGKRMAHVDYLSRNPVSSKTNTDHKVVQKNVNLTEITNDWLQAEQERDVEIDSIIKKLQNDELVENVAKTYEIRKGILHRRIQLNGRTKCLPIIPRAFRWSVINHVHESLFHMGWKKTLEKVYAYYWFPQMSKYVQKFVKSCMTCKLAKSSSGKTQVELHPIPKIEIPWHTVHIDLTGKLSGKNDTKEYVIVQVCAFTKYVLLHHTLQLNAANCIKAVKLGISLFGVPTRVIADQGRCFASKEFKDFCLSLGINLHLIATGASRSNGQVERVMSPLKNMLTVIETSQRSWQDALDEVQLVLNCTVNRVTKYSPLELLIGKQAKPFGLFTIENDQHQIDRTEIRTIASNNIKRSSSYEKNRYDKNKAKIIPFAEGDFVLIKNEERHQTKLDPKFKGPFKVFKVLEGNRYILKALNNNRLYKYAHDRLRGMPKGDDFIDVGSGINIDIDIDKEESGEKDTSSVETDTLLKETI